MTKLAKCLMIQGCTSDAGKSVLVAGLCRVFKRRGVSVAPFKPQNMALNSAVSAEGGEIGRAQALQAVACGIPPSTHFNPVLLKPSLDQISQVIISGKVASVLDAKNFGSIKVMAFDAVLKSYQILRETYDLILIEGAGSPAEINLRKNDIANMGFAEVVDCPVVLVADIDRGGVFAHLTGTINLLSESEQTRIKGLVINKFRGRIELLQSGVDWLESYSDKPVLGVLPFVKELKLDAEDAINLSPAKSRGKIKIKVPILSRISNHTDFDPLKWHPDVDLEFVAFGESLAGADLIILPGTKNVLQDCLLLQNSTWQQDINQHLRYQGKLLGICGGFQMLGMNLHDPQRIEGDGGSMKGLGLLDFDTELYPEKQLKQVNGEFNFGSFNGSIHGYEIHCGLSKGPALAQHFSTITDQNNHCYTEGVVSDDTLIIGTYIHGLFEHKDSLQAILTWVSGKETSTQDWSEIREQELDRFADYLEEYLDIDAIETIIRNSNNNGSQA